MTARVTLCKREPNIRYEPASDEWVVLESFRVHDHVRAKMLIVPNLFRCDGASVPRAAWRIVGKHELGEPAPIVHDFLYRNGGKPFAQLITGYTRAEADALFRDIMEADGVPAWRRNLAYAAVRAFGGRAWKDAA